MPWTSEWLGTPLEVTQGAGGVVCSSGDTEGRCGQGPLAPAQPWSPQAPRWPPAFGPVTGLQALAGPGCDIFPPGTLWLFADKHFAGRCPGHLGGLPQRGQQCPSQVPHPSVWALETHGAATGVFPPGNPRAPTPCPPVLYPQFLDADNLLVNPDTLRLLMAENKTVVAPMLESRAAYANFWCGMTAQVSWGRGGQGCRCTHIRTHTHSQFLQFTVLLARLFRFSSFLHPDTLTGPQLGSWWYPGWLWVVGSRLPSASQRFAPLATRRATTGARPPTSPSGGASVAAASPSPWCTRPSSSTCARRRPGTWPSTRRTPTTPGPSTTSSSSPSPASRRVSCGEAARRVWDGSGCG